MIARAKLDWIPRKWSPTLGVPIFMGKWGPRVPILLGRWGPGVPILGGPHLPMTPAKTGPHFSESLVSFSDCRDSLRSRRLCQVSYASSPLAALPCVYAFLVYNRSSSFAGESGARRGPTGLHRHPRILIPQVVFTAAHCLL